jgi:hypothetical protein
MPIPSSILPAAQHYPRVPHTLPRDRPEISEMFDETTLLQHIKHVRISKNEKSSSIKVYRKMDMLFTNPP